ncbi:putative ADP-ribosylation factor GTPase-activating protein AGD11 [Acorus calamus]|uniref:ADP-ribosylation factor GTPase-activating protein AGD11 n=1 Tax=Acorus calamus TaxID=4465 RepID=A0AAV9CUW6_ACOCL|nr:putative ADP-ribosylation factor GTPase-activating protein AGD11 [Acorus calamus]
MNPYPYPYPSSSQSQSPSMSGIQGQLLEVTVVGCSKLRDTEWISRQDPYVCLEYANTKFRTKTCTDGHKNPSFQEKFTFSLIEGLRELNVSVWNSNTLTFDDFIGNGKVQLQKVLSQGYDDSPWQLMSKHGKYAGEVRLIMHYQNANRSAWPGTPPTNPPYAPYPPQQPPMSSAPYPPPLGYPPVQASPYPSPYPPPPTAYMLTSTYPPQPYPPTSAYPPTSVYPPTNVYPPPPQAQHYPPGCHRVRV